MPSIGVETSAKESPHVGDIFQCTSARPDEFNGDMEFKGMLTSEMRSAVEGIDSDIEDDQPGVLEPSAKSALRAAIFQKWIAKNEDKLQKQVRSSSGKGDVEISMQELLSQQEQIRIVDPRDYQTELFERAKLYNTIAVLPTGSGKTLIAVLLLRHILDRELELRSASASTSPDAPKYAFFLVPTTTLVFQQFAVLECNLDHKVAKLYGTMDNSLWHKSTWDKILHDTMVIVCTPDILYECLSHYYIDMSRINIIVFDEAHHAKQNATYAKIMLDYYHKTEDVSQRPRIFGMTASPVDTKDADLREEVKSLERLLDSRIATIDLASQFVSQAEESVWYYDRARDPIDTVLWSELQAKFGDIDDIQRLLRTARLLNSELGTWAADHFWTFAFTDEMARKMAKRIEKLAEGQAVKVEELDQMLKKLEGAVSFVHEYMLASSPEVNHRDMSSKTLALYTLLTSHFDTQTSGKCIVFVKTRASARLLFHMFSALGAGHLKVGLLTGSGNAKPGDESQTFRKQVQTLLDFRKGEINCIFATSVAEEGLDIPSCNIVIRFDLYDSMIGYVQSRGRARHRNSKFYHMIEKTNYAQLSSVMEARKAAQQMKHWCSMLPQDRVLKGSDADLPDDWIDKLVDQESKATLNSHNALSVLACFVASIQVPSYLSDTNSFRPQYIVTGVPNAWRCEVVLPSHCLVERMVGKVKAKKSLARRSAAFELCKELHKKDYLDKHFLLKEELRKIGPAMRNARIGIHNENTEAYECRIKPQVWLDGVSQLPAEVYVTVLGIAGTLDRPQQPIGLLTRRLLPAFPKFPIYLPNGETRDVISYRQARPIECSASLLENAARFQLTVLADVFMKEFEFDVAGVPYWLVPMVHSTTGEDVYQIDIQALDVVARGVQQWTIDMAYGELTDRYMVDKSSARRIFSTMVDTKKKPDDPVPSYAPTFRFTKSILDYSNSWWKKSRGLDSELWHHDQPVLDAEFVSHWQSMLAPPSNKITSEKKRLAICPQFFRISSLSTRIVATFLMFPAIIHRLENYMIALEGADVVGIRLDAGLALEAFTKTADHSEDDDGQKVISIRNGMGANYERLEFLGDTFLKMATSLSLFVAKPNDNEFDFHVARMLMLNNNNLFAHAKELKLYEYIRSLPFSRTVWYPPRLKLLKGRHADQINRQAVEPRLKQSLGDKSVADVCEALIGAAFYKHNKLGAWDAEQWNDAVRAVTFFVRNKDHDMLCWQDYAKKYIVPAYLLSPARFRDTDLARKVSKEHNYVFKNPRLVSCAFKHPSEPASEDMIPSYQRLEFLGDSLLDLACVSSLYYRYPDKDPQWLTEHKMAIVSNRFLAALCVNIGFHRHLRPWHDEVMSSITKWVEEIQEAERLAGEGEVDYWTKLSSPPKCLSDIVESYIGAIFVDSGFDFSVVQNFFDVQILPYFKDMSLYDTFANNHPVIKLNTKLTEELGCRDFALMAQEVPQDMPGATPRVVAALMIHDEIVAWEVRESGGYAKTAAAKTAYSMLDGLFRIDYRRIYGCDCEPNTDKRHNGHGMTGDMGTAI